jgi:hypothetical protein
MVKKMFAFILGVFFLCLVSTSVFSQQKRMIILKDGTRILGEILAFENNVYTIQSSVGELQINGQDIINISTPGLEPAADPALSQSDRRINPVDSQIANAQEQLMADQDFVSEAKKITEDPEIMKILSQPEIMQAVANRDMDALQSNPQVKDLLSNPKILELIQSASQKIEQPSPSP